MAHEEYKEMLPALALSALDAEDARALNQHLSECVECRRELADWETTAAALALSTNAVDPSPQVRDRIMGAVRRDRQTQEKARVVPFPSTESRSNVWTSFGRVGAIAAAVLCLVLILWIIVLWQQNSALRSENDVLAGQIKRLDREISRSNEFVTILSKPGARFTTLDGVGEGAYWSAYLVYDTTGRALLTSRGLPPAPAGKEYQLWFIVGKNPPIPGKTFTPDNSGRGELSDQIPQQARDSAVFAVTVEPAGGVTAPTGAIYLRSDL
jgi:anti-sigma-K factor RskA